MTRPRIVFLDAGTMGPGVKLHRPAMAHEWLAFENHSEGETIQRLQGATIAITNKVPLGAAELTALPELRLIQVAATGADIMDHDAARAHGVAVRNVAGYGTQSVAEHVIALMLALSRTLVGYHRAVESGAWERSAQFCFFLDPPMQDLAGRRLGLIGVGAIASRVAEIARALGMEVLPSERFDAETIRPGRLPFDEVLASADVLSLHCPLTPATRRLINADRLGAMKPGALLINTARGALLDEEAVLAALEDGRLGGVGLDVTSPEPPPEGSTITRIAAHPRALVTPHMAWGSLGARQECWNRVIASIEDFLASAG